MGDLIVIGLHGRIRPPGIVHGVPSFANWLAVRSWGAQYRPACGGNGHRSKIAGVNRRGVPTPIGEPSHWYTKRWRGQFWTLVYILATNLLRAIDRFVDLSDVRSDMAPFYSSTGRPSIDPELLVRMLLVGYCCGVRS